jgi:hypothetical protein
LTLKLSRFRDMNPSLEKQVEKIFAQSQFENYIAELTSALVDSRYTINDSNTPSEIELVSCIKNSLSHELKNQHKRIKL